MSELETVEFKITLDSIWHNDAPKYEILLDNESIDSGVVIEKNSDEQEKVILFKRDLEEGSYTLKIRLLDKLPKHTPVDKNGNIIADQLLNIKQIEIDEIELDHLFYSLGEFYKQTQTNNNLPVYSNEPESEKYINLGWNGEYRLKFSVPTYMWFLENL